MKKIYIIIIHILIAAMVAKGQGAPGNLPSDISLTTMTVSPSTAQNYVVTYSYRKEFTSHPSSIKTGDANPTIQYFDGLGRPVQTVAVKASQLGKDMVDLQTYDNYGRTEKSYLPFGKSSNNGAYVSETSFTGLQNTFLSGIYGSTDGSKGYAETGYESSPLNRVLKQGAPGASWQLTANPVEYAYKTNTSTIASWKYSGDSYSSFSYAAGTLFLLETTDEDNNLVKEYTDKEGRLVQREAGTAKTRYCYDKFGLLRCVLQPLATSPATTNYCFYYKYDERKRLTDRKVPGKFWEYFIYDSRDRLVLSQDGNQREEYSGQWTYTIYNDLNQPVEQGTWATSIARITLENSIQSNLNYMSGQSGRVVYKHFNYKTYSAAHSIGSDASALGVTPASDNTGRLTRTDTKALNYETGMDYWIKTTYYYDKFGRVIQEVKDNHLNGVNYITNKYNFANEIIQTRYRHTADGVTTYIDQYNDYDHRGRPTKIRHKINGANEKLLAGYSYDETGKLIDKYLHSESGSAFLQRLDYKYNIRGWLTEIDNPSSFSENDKFGLRLFYNGGPYPSSTLYNGNIAGMMWGTPNYSSMYYVFAYDDNNRLTQANFYKSGSGANDLDVNYEYDQNGNITSLLRKDFNGNIIDDLDYYYNGNLVSYVSDQAGDIAGITDYPGSIALDNFDYDFNGNMIYETNKMTYIYYNLLNLPREISFFTNRKIKYFYTFDGEKLRKTVENNGIVTKVDYCGPFVYETASGVRSLKYFVTPEGRAVKNGSTWDYEYNLKDHLGNTRVVIRKGGSGLAEVIQERHYYPFGMEMSELSYGTGSNKYLYNSKEIQNDFDLYWYDYGARFYDPMLGRFHSVDPLATDYYFQSPYAYAANNPILFIDWLGMEPKIKGPYSGRTYVRNNGTVVLYRVTTSQRVMANTTKQAIYSAGWLGIGLSMTEAIGGFDGRGIAETSGGAAVQFGKDLSKAAADDVVVGINRGMFASSAKSLNVFGKVLSAYQIGRAIADDTPTQSEALHSAAFNFGKKFQGGNINIANSSLLEFSNGENPESVENHMNAIYNTLEQNLSGFDLTTNKGVSEANKHLNDNLGQIIKQINQMLQDDENK